MNYILYCVINSRKLVYETLYSIISIQKIQKNNSNLKIIIMTNMLDDFISIIKNNKIAMQNVIFEEISFSIVCDWTLQNQYIYGVKMNSINYFLNKYKANVLFLDSDILALKDIDILFRAIEENNILLYAKLSSRLNNHKHLENINKNIIKENYYEFEFNDKKIKYFFEEPYYNTGVIGVSYQHRHLINNILDEMQIILGSTRYFGADDLAASHIFHKHSIITTNEHFIHYFTNDEIRLYYAFTIDVYLSNEKKELHDIFKECKHSEKLLISLSINDFNFKYFAYLLLSYKRHGVILNINKLLTNAIIEGYVTNNRKEKTTFIKCFEEFRLLL